MNEMIYTYDGSFEGFLCCIFDSYANKEVLTAITDDEDSAPILFPVRAIQTDSGHAGRVLRKLHKLSPFSELGGILGSEIEPKNRVLPILRGHFCARYQNEKFFIYDRTHHEALFYAAGKAVIRPLADFQMAPPNETEAAYRLLWKRFYDTVAIRERENPKLRMTHMPKRYWSTMTEFQDDPYFTPQSSAAAVPVPGVPAGKPALGTPPAPGRPAPASAP